MRYGPTRYTQGLGSGHRQQLKHGRSDNPNTPMVSTPMPHRETTHMLVYVHGCVLQLQLHQRPIHRHLAGGRILIHTM